MIQSKNSKSLSESLQAFKHLCVLTLVLTTLACTTQPSAPLKQDQIHVETYLLQKCPLNLLVELPESTPLQPVPPKVSSAIEIHNLTLMNECINRQSILIDVIEDLNKKRQ